MLLAAEEGNQLALLTPEKDLPAGTQISSGMEPGEKVVTFKEFQKLEMRSGRAVAGDVSSLDLGSRRVTGSFGDLDSARKYAAFVAGDKALLMHGPEKVRIIFDKDIPVGAKIR